MPFFNKISIFTILLIFQANIGFCWFFSKPSNYKECIDEYAEDVENANALTMVKTYCEYKFVQKSHTENSDKYFDCVISNAINEETNDKVRLEVNKCYLKYKK